MKRSNALRQMGVTLTELLVVVVIISILSTIAVPVYINKAENAKKAAALVDCREIADAEEACAAHHGFYVPIQLLDDMPANSITTSDPDTIDRETNCFLIDPNKTTSLLNQKQPQISTASDDARVRNLIRDWQGPFLNPQRVFVNKDTSGNLILGFNRMDQPLDPWGNPYRFYAPNPFGVIGDLAGSTKVTDYSSTNFSNGHVTNTDNTRQFDRFAIISYGPNGMSDTDTNASAQDQKDDIIYFFGRVRAESTFNAVGGTTSTTTNGQ